MAPSAKFNSNPLRIRVMILAYLYNLFPPEKKKKCKMSKLVKIALDVFSRPGETDGKETYFMLHDPG